MPDSTERFSSRVDDYVRYRPSYPTGVVDILRRECGLTRDSVVADVASGTGIFTKLLLENGNPVYGVEPNADMRGAGEEYLAGYSKFISVAGTAEATTLADHSIDLVTAAQAAHWFKRELARREFARILKPGGFAVLLWNQRRVGSTPFLRDYEQLLLTYGTDYKEVRHERTTDAIEEFFVPSPFRTAQLEITQEVDYDGLKGRLVSSSYTPAADDARYDPMLRGLREIFDRHNVGGRVGLDYDTLIYWGEIK
jgi:SAM-dependent methyltransferase